MTAEPGRWDIEFDVRIPGWLEIPRLSGADHEGFADGAVADLPELLGDSWSPEREPLARDIIRQGLEQRDDSTDFAFQVWSRQIDAVASVEVRFGSAAGMPDFAADGYRVRPTDMATNIGPGFEAVLTRQMQFEDEDLPVVTVAHALFVFSDGDSALVVEVEPTPVDLLRVVMIGLGGLLDSLTITASDGTRFSTVPDDPLVALDTIWPQPKDEAAGGAEND